MNVGNFTSGRLNIVQNTVIYNDRRTKPATYDVFFCFVSELLVLCIFFRFGLKTPIESLSSDIVPLELSVLKI